ncbi:MAG: ribokinase [Bacteroides sp.]|nr:ribokinase [Bacteroides sp.]
MIKICCIGHITLDKVITPRLSVDMPGGTAFYFGHAMSHLRHDGFRLVTSLAESEKKAVDNLRAKGIDVVMIPSRQSVCFENKYGEDMNHRTQRVLAKADPFTIDTLKNEEAEIFHLGTLLADDFSPEVLKYLSGKGRVSVDAQGYLREVRGENVYPVDWEGKEAALPYIDILKVNEHEMEALTGLTQPDAAAEKLADMGVKEVVITLGSEGSLIYHEGVFYEIPAYEAKEVVDATGCGDTYMAGYLYKRSLGCPIDECGRFAAAMCTIKLGAAGPFSASESDIESVINS